THFPGVRLQPLGHLSNKLFQISEVVTHLRAQTLMNFQAFGNSLWKNRGKNYTAGRHRLTNERFTGYRYCRNHRETTEPYLSLAKGEQQC
ncbi:MAG: hypothetical protein KA296_07020, partial [Marinobacter sp.]|nr:hypothetical protein [Marinobacter sp.]